MLSFAHLASVIHLLSRTSFSNVVYDGERFISCQLSMNGAETPLSFDLARLTSRELYFEPMLAQLPDRVMLTERLLGKELPKGNGETQDYVMLYLLEGLINNSIDSYVRDGVIYYNAFSYSSSITISSCDWCDYDLLTASKLMRACYQISEVMGAHYRVVTPPPVRAIHVVQANACTCNEWLTNTDCSHVRLARVARDNRQLFSSLNLIGLISA